MSENVLNEALINTVKFFIEQFPGSHFKMDLTNLLKLLCFSIAYKYQTRIKVYENVLIKSLITKCAAKFIIYYDKNFCSPMPIARTIKI